MSVLELQISELVSSGSSIIEESEIIPDKQRVTIHIYEASCPDSALALSRIEFGSKVLWVIQRDSTIPKKIKLVGNGTDTLKLICENGCNDAYYFNAYVKGSFDV